MSDVVSFRPTDEERELLDRAQRALGLATRTEALRYLVRKGGVSLKDSGAWPLFRVRARVPWQGELSSRAIDDALYGDL